jgi:CubicO group peptidase (beta-lactamase class C family)
MSKAFTAAAISLLVDDEKNYPDVQWNAPVSSLIREDFVLSDSRYTEQVTVEDILSHRSGLPEYASCSVAVLLCCSTLLISAVMMMLALGCLPMSLIRPSR